MCAYGVYMHICVSVCDMFMFVGGSIYVCEYVWHVCIYVSVYVCVCAYVHVCISVCLCMCVTMCVCGYASVYVKSITDSAGREKGKDQGRRRSEDHIPTQVFNYTGHRESCSHMGAPTPGPLRRFRKLSGRQRKG